MQPELFQKTDQVEKTHWWFAGRRQIIADLIRRRVKPVNSAKILDVGCATGGNFELLGAFGKVTGLEPDDTARQLALKKGTAPVLKGAISASIPFQNGSFDLVAALDVLEHIDNDDEALASIMRLLKSGGSLVATVPAYRFLWSRHDLSHRHYRRYLRAELSAKLKSAGFQITFISYFNTLLFPIIVLLRCINKLTGACDSSDLDIPAAPLNKILAVIFENEKWLLRFTSLPFGVSMVACAKKPL